MSFTGEWHGIHRFIPIEYPGPRGTNYTLFLDVSSVTDGSGGKLKYDSSTSNGFRDLKIYIPGAVDTERTVEITYLVRNGMRFFEDHDEFYWNVTGNDWPVPIDHASAFVAFPDAAAGSLRAQAFTGVYGSAGHDATSEVKGADCSFDTVNPLPMRGGLTIDIYIPRDILKEPSGFTRFIWFIGSNPIVFLPFWAFAIMYFTWWKWGRDPDPGVSVAPMYEPPKGLSPAEAGTLLEDKIHPRDITSTIVDLAVRGFIKIEEVDDKGLVFHHKDYILHSLKPVSEWSDLAPHEKVMLTNIFTGGDVTPLSSLKNRFYTAIPAVRQDIMAALKNKGMYLLDPDTANGYSFVALLVIVAPFLASQFSGFKNVFSSVGLLVGCGIISAIIWWLFAREMTAKTVTGGRTRVAVLGFQEFMNRVDADRLKRMPPDTFEKYLPYAMALGVEHRWAQAFAGIVQNPRPGSLAPAGTPTVRVSIQFSSPIQCTAWRTICIKCSSPPHGRVRRDPASVEVAAVADSPAVDSVEAAEARSKLASAYFACNDSTYLARFRIRCSAMALWLSSSELNNGNQTGMSDEPWAGVGSTAPNCKTE